VIDGEVAAFLLAFREGARYDGEHYRWFCAHYPRFLYVDRVVVRKDHQGRQLGSHLYRDVFSVARHADVPWVTCEIDVMPPNETSIRFHQKFGFSEIGRHAAAAATKTVSLQAAPV
jgi:predicted GNAT superfamily acetyltransferase